MNPSPVDHRHVVRSYLLQHKGKILVAFIASVFLALSSLCLAYLIGPSLTFVLQKKQESYLVKELLGPQIAFFFQYLSPRTVVSHGKLLEILVFYLVLFAVIKALCSVLQAFLWEMIGEKIAFDLRLKFFSLYVCSHPHSKPLLEESEFDKNMATLVTTDVKLFRDYLVNVWGGLSRELIQLVALSLGLVFLSPLLFVSFVFCLLPVSLILKKVGRKLSTRSSDAIAGYSLLSEWLQERFLGLETIKARRTEAYEIKKMKDLNHELFDKHYKLAYTQSRTSPLLEMVAVFALIVVIFVALILIRQGYISSSVVFSFFALLAILSQSINKMGRYFNKNKASMGSRSRVLKYLAFLEENLKEPKASPKVLEAPKKDEILRVKDLSFSYKGRSTCGVKGFEYSFLREKFYCITGPSGCGKSTLLKCLLGLLPPRTGVIYYHEELLPLSKVAYVSQKISLPPVSLAACVSYPEEHFDEGRLLESLRKVNLLDHVQTLEKGFLTPLGDEVDTGFSGGQNQKLLLARLFYHGYPLVLIDEGTASLDSESEEIVCKSLQELVEKTSCTVIFVSHSQTVMQYANDVIYMT